MEFKEKLIKSMASNIDEDKKRIQQLNSLWSEVLQHNHQLEIDLKQQTKETKSWQQLANETMNENKLLKQLFFSVLYKL